MAITIGPTQEQMVSAAAARIDAAQGEVRLADLADPLIVTSRRLSFLTHATKIGQHLTEELRESEGESDYQLSVFTDDLTYAKPKILQQGLYFLPREVWLRPLKNVVTVGHYTCRLSLEGIRRQHEGVVINGIDYETIARSPKHLADAVYAKNRGNNRAAVHREEADERAHRAAIHALDSKTEKLKSLDAETLDHERLARRVYEAATYPPRRTRRQNSLERDRQIFEELFHDLVELSVLNSNLGTNEIKGLHRAYNVKHYRSRSTKEASIAFRQSASVLGRYKQAIRGKIDQSIQGVEHELEQRQQYRHTKETIAKET